MSCSRDDKAFRLSEDTKCLECGLISIALGLLQKRNEQSTVGWKLRLPFLTKGDCNERGYSPSRFASWSCSGLLPGGFLVPFCSLWSAIWYNRGVHQ